MSPISSDHSKPIVFSKGTQEHVSNREISSCKHRRRSIKAAMSNLDRFVTFCLNNIDDVEKLYRILSLRGRVSEYKSTPLAIACMTGGYELAKYSIEVRKIPLHASYLSCAVENQHFEVVRLLLEHGALENEYETSPLAIACNKGHLGIVQILIEYGADVNYVLSNGNTILMETVVQGNHAVAEKLIELNADIYKRTENDETVMDLCVTYGDLIAMKMLLTHGLDVNRHYRSGDTLLIGACRRNNLSLVSLLIENGAKMIPNSSGITPMMVACEYIHCPLIKILVDGGADIYEVLTRERTWKDVLTHVREGYENRNYFVVLTLFALKPCATKTSAADESRWDEPVFLWACRMNQCDIVRFLIGIGINPDGQDANGITGLMMASCCNNPEVARMLIHSKADVNRTDNSGNSELYKWTYLENIGMIRCLIENGATLQKNNNGLTPLFKACMLRNMDIVNLMLSYPGLVTREQKIEALELLGALLWDTEQVAYTGLMWKRAMLERCGNPPINKPIVKAIPAYGNRVEASNLEEVAAVSATGGSAGYEALLILERILGRRSSVTCGMLCSVSMFFCDNFLFSESLRLGHRALDIMYGEKLYSVQLLETALDCIAQTVYNGFNNNWFYPDELLSSYVIAYRGIEQLTLLKYRKVDKCFASALVIVRLMMELPSDSFPDEYVCHATYRLVQLAKKLPDFPQSLLHLAVSQNVFHRLFDGYYFPSLPFVKLLLRAGADPNAQDQYRNTPLHEAVMYKPYVKSIVLALLEAGADFDIANADGKTFADIQREVHGVPFENSGRYMKLRCLAAKCIRQYGLRYKGIVPLALESVIRKH